MRDYLIRTPRLARASLFTGLLLMVSNGLPVSGASADTGQETRIIDFSSAAESPGWYIVNDNVMGGRSEGSFRLDADTLHFSGRTNTRGGGFSSIRTQPLAIDLSSYAGIRLRVQGDGRRYTWRLTTAARWRGREVAYWAEFDTEDREWLAVDVPFTRFVPRFRGMQLDGPPLDPARINGMGLMINDGRDGPFELRLANVRAYSVEALLTLDAYRWKQRILVLSAPDEDNAALKTMQQRVAASAEEFADRDLLLLTLLDEGISGAGDRALNTSEVAALRNALDLGAGAFELRLIGKDGTLKLSSDVAIPLEEIYGLIDTMPMRQRELRERH